MNKTLSPEKILNILGNFTPKRENLITVLHIIQDEEPLHYLTEEALTLTAKHFNMSKGQVFGVASYYSMFSFKPRATHLIRLCQSPVCRMMGSKDIVTYLETKHQIRQGETPNNTLFLLELCECLGSCNQAPSMMINEQLYEGLTPQKIDTIIENLKGKSHDEK